MVQGMHWADTCSIHSHRQAECGLKAVSGSVKNDTTLRRWMRASPENGNSFSFTHSHLSCSALVSYIIKMPLPGPSLHHCPSPDHLSFKESPWLAHKLWIHVPHVCIRKQSPSGDLLFSTTLCCASWMTLSVPSSAFMQTLSCKQETWQWMLHPSKVRWSVLIPPERPIYLPLLQELEKGSEMWSCMPDFNVRGYKFTCWNALLIQTALLFLSFYLSYCFYFIFLSPWISVVFM